MSNTYIIPTKIFEQIMQRARKLKRSEGIPHHETLEKVAKSLRFENWHQLTLAAEETRVAETARRCELIIALDIKDALECKFDHDGAFAQDDRLMSVCESDLFQKSTSAPRYVTARIALISSRRSIPSSVIARNAFRVCMS